MSSQTAPPAIRRDIDTLLTQRHDPTAFGRLVAPGQLILTPNAFGIELPPKTDPLGFPFSPIPLPYTCEAAIVAAVAQEQVAARILRTILDSVPPLRTDASDDDWRACVIPLGSWRNGRLLGITEPNARTLVVPCAGQHGIAPDNAAADFRLVGLPARAWLRLVVHEATHALQFRDFGDEVPDGKTDYHTLPSWRMSCERVARAFGGEALPTGTDVRFFPENVPHLTGLIAAFERELRHHLSPPRLLLHGACTADRVVIDVAAETVRDIALGLVEPERVRVPA